MLTFRLHKGARLYNIFKKSLNIKNTDDRGARSRILNPDSTGKDKVESGSDPGQILGDLQPC